MKRSRKHTHPDERLRPALSDPFDAWLAMLGAAVFEPVTDLLRAAGRLIHGAGRRPRRRSQGKGRSRDKP